MWTLTVTFIYTC